MSHIALVILYVYWIISDCVFLHIVWNYNACFGRKVWKPYIWEHFCNWHVFPREFDQKHNTVPIQITFICNFWHMNFRMVCEFQIISYFLYSIVLFLYGSILYCLIITKNWNNYVHFLFYYSIFYYLNLL